MRENCPGKFNKGAQKCIDCGMSEGTVRCPDELHMVVCDTCKNMYDSYIYKDTCPLCNHENSEYGLFGQPIDFEEPESE